MLIASQQQYIEQAAQQLALAEKASQMAAEASAAIPEVINVKFEPIDVRVNLTGESAFTSTFTQTVIDTVRTQVIGEVGRAFDRLGLDRNTLNNKPAPKGNFDQG